MKIQLLSNHSCADGSKTTEVDGVYNFKIQNSTVSWSPEIPHFVLLSFTPPLKQPSPRLKCSNEFDRTSRLQITSSHISLGSCGSLRLLTTLEKLQGAISCFFCSLVLDNTGTLFCCEAPEMFCQTQNFNFDSEDCLSSLSSFRLVERLSLDFLWNIREISHE